MFADAQHSPGNGAPMFVDEQHSTGIGASTFIDSHYSTADGAPTFTDTQHSQINGAPTFVDAPFRFEVQYLAVGIFFFGAIDYVQRYSIVLTSPKN